MTVTSTAECGVPGPASGIVLHGDARTVIHGVGEPVVTGLSPEGVEQTWGRSGSDTHLTGVQAPIHDGGSHLRTPWAPSGDHRICWRLFMRALTRLLTTDSAPELAIRKPALYRRP